MDWGEVQKDLRSNNLEEMSRNDITKFSLDGNAPGNFCKVPGPSPSLLAALRSLGEHSDHMLLPHSLHQIAEAYFLEEDLTVADPWAVHFLRLERLYHERLLSNLASLQQEWESQWKADTQARNGTPLKTNCSDAESKYMDSLSHICRTHQRPNRTMEKDAVDPMLKISPRQATENSGTTGRTPAKTEEQTDDASQLQTDLQAEDNEEEQEEEEDEEEDLMEELQKEEESRGERVYGEDLAKPIQVEETFPSNGLVSILKKRACLEDDDSVYHAQSHSSYKRKVRFSETDDALDNDEVGGASCLVFLLLCLVTVVISMGGTALYCLLGGAYSNICTDFSQNINFYFGPVWRGIKLFGCLVPINNTMNFDSVKDRD